MNTPQTPKPKKSYYLKLLDQYPEIVWLLTPRSDLKKLIEVDKITMRNRQRENSRLTEPVI